MSTLTKIFTIADLNALDEASWRDLQQAFEEADGRDRREMFSRVNAGFKSQRTGTGVGDDFARIAALATSEVRAYLNAGKFTPGSKPSAVVQAGMILGKAEAYRQLSEDQKVVYDRLVAIP